MNVAHDLDRAGNDAIVVRGRHLIISSKISAGNAESIVIKAAEELALICCKYKPNR